MGFPARYKGACLKCQGTVYPGHFVTWSRTKGQKGVYHVDCNNLMGTGLTGSDKDTVLDKQITVAVEPEPEPVSLAKSFEPMTIDVPAVSVATPVLANDPIHSRHHYIQPDPVYVAVPNPNGTGLVAAPKHNPIEGVTVSHKDGFLEMIAQAVMGDILAKLPQSSGIDTVQVKALIEEYAKDFLPTVVKVQQADKPTITIKNVHRKFPRLVARITERRHCYLYGSHGTGKSTAAQQVAESLGLRYGYISLTPQTPESRILGYMNAHGAYVRTEFRECYEFGGLYCVDEMDNMNQALATTWNGALENGHMSFPDALVPRHHDFVMVGTGNTSGNGAHPSYPERRPFDKSFKDRFVYLEWEVDPKLEKHVALAYWQDAKPWVEWVQDVRKWAEKNYPKLVPSPRVTFDIARSLDKGHSIDDTLAEVFWKGDKEAKDKVLANNPLPA